MSILIKNFPFLLLIFLAYNLWDGISVKNDAISVLENENKPVLESNILKLKGALKKSKAIEAQLTVFRDRIAEVTKQITEVQKQLPETLVETDILDLFAKETNILNIKDVTFTPGEERSKDFYMVKKYLIKGRGTHLQFLVFFERLRKQERIFNVEDIKITTPKEESKGRFHLVDLEATIEAFRYNPSFKESSETLEKEAEKEIEDRKGKNAPEAAPASPSPGATI